MLDRGDRACWGQSLGWYLGLEVPGSSSFSGARGTHSCNSRTNGLAGTGESVLVDGLGPGSEGHMSQLEAVVQSKDGASTELSPGSGRHIT